MSRDPQSDELVDAGDLRLVEALYGEGSEDEVDADELASYRELRSMFADLPEADPPAAVSAKLMSAAAEAVATNKAGAPEKRGLWARLLAIFEPLAAHPALAAAASLLLVVTVGGVLMLTGRSEVTEPSATPPTGEVTGAQEKAAEADDEESEPPPVAEPEPAAPPPPDPTETAPVETKPPAKTRRPKKSSTPDRRVDKTRATVGGKRARGKTGLDFSGGSLADDDAPTSDKREDADRAPADQGSGDLPTMQPQKPTRTAAEVERLTSRGRKAAAARDCEAVIEVGTRVRALDPDHYRDVYRRDTRINACYKQRRQAK